MTDIVSLFGFGWNVATMTENEQTDDMMMVQLMPHGTFILTKTYEREFYSNFSTLG